MDALTELFEAIRRHGLAEGSFRGLLNLLIGRRIATAGGAVISKGFTWRELAGWLKKVRWSKESIRELGLDPDAMPPRDRQQYWYTAIARSGVDSAEAKAQADQLAERLRALGYVIGPAPGK